MRHSYFLFAFLFLAGFTCVSISPAQEMTVYVEKGGVQVTEMDVQAYLADIPPRQHAGLLADADRIGALLNNILVNKTLATRARAQGMDETALMQRRMELTSNVVLGKQFLTDMVEAEMGDASFAAEAKEFYLARKDEFVVPAQTAASHILIGTRSRTEKEALELARLVKDQLAEGESFEKLASEHSDDINTAKRGGSLGYLESGSLVPDFEAALQELESPGDMSPIVSTEYGYHIIRLDGNKQERQQSLDEVQTQIERQLAQKRAKELRAQYIAEISSAEGADFNPEAIGALKTPMVEPPATAGNEKSDS